MRISREHGTSLVASQHCWVQCKASKGIGLRFPSHCLYSASCFRESCAAATCRYACRWLASPCRPDGDVWASCGVGPAVLECLSGGVLLLPRMLEILCSLSLTVSYAKSASSAGFDLGFYAVYAFHICTFARQLSFWPRISRIAF